jgi:nucleotide-binding universal stress UspA family protein
VIFERVVCGVETSPESLVAVRQAARLVEPDGRLVLTAVADVAIAVHAGWAATAVHEEIVTEAQTALATAGTEAPNAETALLQGSPGESLLSTTRMEGADLIVVGTHGGSRAKGIVLGSVATLMLHEAPCSVLIARPSANGADFPRHICIGVDGSASSAHAAETGRALAARFSAAKTIVAACGEKKLNLDELRTVEPNAEIDHRPAVEALVAKAAEAGADLLVVGSRGLHGVKALGSVSERVAHRAGCSVLVVREKETEIE